MPRLRLNKVLAQAGLTSRRGAERLISEGRVANDGTLTHRLLHPRYEVPRVYEADVAGDVRADDLSRWRRGVTLEDGPARPLDVARLGRGDGATTRLKLTFTEGRKHEVKRYCEALGHRVVRLRRVEFGPIELGRLRPGQWRALTPREVAQLRRTVVES